MVQSRVSPAEAVRNHPVRVKYFSRYEGLNDYSVVMRDDQGFESVVCTARSREQADKKAVRFQAKEDRSEP